MTQKFEPGDKVKCAFFDDELFELEGFSEFEIRFQRGDTTYYFATDGRYSTNHTRPVLALVEKKKEKLRMECWVLWVEKSGWMVPCSPLDGWGALRGKRGKLIFEEE